MEIRKAIDVRPDQFDLLLKMIKQFLPHKEVWAYGSRVKGSSTEKSDLDLVVFLRNDKDTCISELKEAFDESDLLFRVDLFVWEDVPEQFHKNIQAEHVVIQKRGY